MRFHMGGYIRIRIIFYAMKLIETIWTKLHIANHAPSYSIAVSFCSVDGPGEFISICSFPFLFLYNPPNSIVILLQQIVTVLTRFSWFSFNGWMELTIKSIPKLFIQRFLVNSSTSFF